MCVLNIYLWDFSDVYFDYFLQVLALNYDTCYD